MSYGLQIWSVRELTQEALPSPQDWKLIQEAQWTREEPGWRVSVFRSVRVKQEDLPDKEFAQLLPGIQFMTELGLEGPDTKSNAKVLNATADAIAKALHGVIYDPQEDAVNMPEGVKRFARPEKQERFSVLSFSWWFLGNQLTTSSGIERLLALLEQRFPEALPRRYGLDEPPQRVYTQASKSDFVKFFLENLHYHIVWYTNRPVTHFGLSVPKKIGANKAGFIANQLQIDVETAALAQPGWPENLRQFWREMSFFLNPFYGEVRTMSGFVWRGSTVCQDQKTENHPVAGWWWRGVPRKLGCAVVLGEDYQNVWPDFRKHATIENNLAFVESPDWGANTKVTKTIGRPPRGITLKSPDAFGRRSERYPRVWPFGEPFDPPRSFLQKLRGLLLGGILLASLPLAAGVEAQTTYTLKPTPAQDEQHPLIYVKHLVPPRGYPPLARQTRLRGTIVIKLTIASDGTVLEAESIPGDKDTSGFQMLRDDAEKLVKKWTFGCVGCSPNAPFEHTIRFNYVMDTEDILPDNWITIDLPDEVTMHATPPVIDHGPPPPKKSKKGSN